MPRLHKPERHARSDLALFAVVARREVAHQNIHVFGRAHGLHRLQARALALAVADPDAPRGTFLHWLVTGLDAADGGIEEGGSVPAGGRQWPNSGRSARWVPPCPPSGTHRYFFGVYALDAPVDAETTQQVLDEIGKHTIAWGTLLGLVDH